MGARSRSDTQLATAEIYCATIQALREDAIAPIQARLHERLNASRSTISETVATLADHGYIARDEVLMLTEQGLEIAERTLRRRRLAELFLIDSLDLSLAQSVVEAANWVTAISAELEVRLIAKLGRPSVSPFGNPIPYEVRPDPATPSLPTLAGVEPGSSFQIARIREELVAAHNMIDYLEGSGLVPGGEATVESVAPDGTMSVVRDGVRVGFGPFVTTRLIVA